MNELCSDQEYHDKLYTTVFKNADLIPTCKILVFTGFPLVLTGVFAVLQ